MSSHREAPESSKDPVADNTDVYAFVSPDRPDSVTLIANFIPFQVPEGGPNFYTFGDDVLYEIHVSNAGTSTSDIAFQFRFNTEVQDPNTFLYNTGTITSLQDPTYNRRQYYTVTRVDARGSRELGTGLLTPPCNIGPHSTPNYVANLANPAVYDLPDGIRVFAGQRADGFYIDLAAIFDGLNLRPLQTLHTGPLAPAAPFNAFQGLNVHTIAIQLPKTALTVDGTDPTDWRNRGSVIGVYASASRQATKVFGEDGSRLNSGPFVQVSRLANPLFNELLIPLPRKDYWNASKPENDGQFQDRVEQCEVAKRLPGLYPNVFNSLASYTKPRADLVAILLTGLPEGVVPGFQNFTGGPPADLMRLNMAIPPSAGPPQNLGVVAGDLAGFPNGRRVADDVVSIELKAVAGATIPLVDPSFVPDLPVAALLSFVTPSNQPFLPNFPYLGTPNNGADSLPKNITPIV